jgi:hypothetical protein
MDSSFLGQLYVAKSNIHTLKKILKKILLRRNIKIHLLINSFKQILIFTA